MSKEAAEPLSAADALKRDVGYRSIDQHVKSNMAVRGIRDVGP